MEHGVKNGPKAGSHVRADREFVFKKLKESKKYKYLCDHTLYRISDWAVERYDPGKAEKAAKNKLHQVCGAYFEKMNVNKIQKELDGLPDAPDNAALESAAIKIMKYHTSTSERIPFMEQFYSDLFNRIGKPRKILDLACGLNPFSVPWMKLQPDAGYIAFDIDHRLISVINTFFNRLPGPYKAGCVDILVSIPETEADVVFLLKTLPCLEQQEKGISEKIIKELNAKYTIISFPSKSLTGREKGMATYYRQFIVGILDKLELKYFQLEYSNEFFLVIRKE
jgi:16S rRNA (guanine(1405)-N(7))-methyltransferase